MPTFDQPFVCLAFDASTTYPTDAVFVIDAWQDGEFASGLIEHREVPGTVADLDSYIAQHLSAPCWNYRIHVRLPLQCDALELTARLNAVSRPQAA